MESSLEISALEQVEVMERIFGEQPAGRPESLERLKIAVRVLSAPAPGVCSPDIRPCERRLSPTATHSNLVKINIRPSI